MAANAIYEFLKLGTDGPLCSDNIVFLLGAGASRDAGIPTLAGMMDSYEKRDNNKIKACEKLANLYDYFKEKSKRSQYSLGSSGNIEDMLAIMEDFLHLHDRRGIMYDLVSSWDKELVEIFQYDWALIKKLRDDLKEHVIQELCWHHKDGNVEKLAYFHFIFYLQKQLGGTLKSLPSITTVVLKKLTSPITRNTIQTA
jgi:hypothetical protein